MPYFRSLSTAPASAAERLGGGAARPNLIILEDAGQGGHGRLGVGPTLPRRGRRLHARGRPGLRQLDQVGGQLGDALATKLLLMPTVCVPAATSPMKFAVAQRAVASPCSMVSRIAADSRFARRLRTSTSIF